MKRFPILFVAALMMAAVSAPAQRRGDLRGERHARGGIVSARQHVGANHNARQVASRQVASRQAASRQVARQAASRPVVSRNITRRGNQRGHARSGRYVEPVRRVSRRGHGYWRTVCEPVLVEAGHWHRQHVPAVYGWTYDSCGHLVWGIVEPACYKRVWCPPRYEDRTRRVWVRY